MRLWAKRLSFIDPRETVLLVQPIYAHYRFGTLRKLSESESLRFSFAAGSTLPSEEVGVFENSALPTGRSLRNLWVGKVLWQRGLLSQIWSMQPSAVILPGSVHYLSSWAGAILSRIRGHKVLFWTTGWHRPESGGKRLLRLSFYKLAHHLLLYNERSAAIGVAQGYPNARMTVVYNSQQSPPASAAHQATEDDKFILSKCSEEIVPTLVAVARLNQVKRFDLLIRATATLAASGTHVKVVIAGDGAERNSLIELAKSLHVDLTLLGAIYDDGRLSQLYASAALTVVPGAVGLTAIQSLQHGVPVISHSNPDSQVAEWEAIQPGVTGDYFREGDKADLARTIQRWLRKVDFMSPAISAQCRNEYEIKWTALAHARRIEAATLKVLASTGPNTRADR